MSQYWKTTHICTSFRSPKFLPSPLFLFQDPKQGTTLDLVVMFPRHLWTMRISHVFTVFDDDSFVGQVFCRMTLYLSGVLFCFFFQGKIGAMSFFGEEDHGSKMPFSWNHFKVTYNKHVFSADFDLEHWDSVCQIFLPWSW